MLIYSDSPKIMNKSSLNTTAKHIHSSYSEAKTTSRRRKRLSKKNIDFLISAGLKIKKSK